MTKSINIAHEILYKIKIKYLERKQLRKYLRIVDKSRFDYLNNLSIPNKKDTLRICGNGDSLNDMEITDGADYLVVNYCASSPKFLAIKPRFYVVLDPLAFATEYDINNMLAPIVSKVDWDMYFCTRTSVKSEKIDKLFETNPHIHLIYWNSWSVAHFYENNKLFCYEHNLGIPCDENVLCGSIYLGIMLKYKRIELYGVNHDWIKYIFVDDDNKVKIYDRHFYDSEKSTCITHEIVPGVPSKLHEVLQEYANVFKGYMELRKLADNRHIEIINFTKGSYIDAFIRS